jgi:hypothetical protein
MAQNPRYRYLFGAVSISDEYSSMSQQLMTAFLSANHLFDELTDCVTPFHPLAWAALSNDDEARVDAIADLDELSALVRELERGQRGVPVLLKYYLKLGGRLLGFGIDPQFNNSVDGLILVDMLQAPPRLVEKYLGAENIPAFRAYHQQVTSDKLAHV